MLATIRIIQATEDEFAVIGTGEATEGGGMRSTYAGGVVSPRNELATYTSLRELLYAKLRPEAAQVMTRFTWIEFVCGRIFCSLCCHWPALTTQNEYIL